MKSKRNILLSHADLPPVALQYLADAKMRLALGTCLRHRTMLFRFHRWLAAGGLMVGDLTPEHLTEYRRWCGTLEIQSNTADVDHYHARSYVVWLIRAGHLKANVTNFFQFSLKPANLPPFTQLFLKHRAATTKYAHARYRQLLHLFHNWLLDHDLDVASLNRENIIHFLSFLGARGYAPKQLHVRRLHIRIYFDWLRDRDLTKADTTGLFETVEQFRNFALPAYTEEYLQEIQTTLREDTVKGYKTNFMAFHRFLHRRSIDIRNLNRDHCLSWMRYMFETKKYSQSTRLQRLVNTKGYLLWLAENGVIKAEVDKLIKSSDFPKLDLVLPKPLPIEVDREIQRRLFESNNIYHKAALLLRLTGMRLGELSNLSFHPIWSDDSGKTYIKIPIGKLHSERLVPIDDKAIAIIETIQRGSLPHLKTFSNEPEKGKLLLGPKGGSALHNIYRHFKLISGDLAGRGSIHPHRLRHTFATALMNADLNPLVVMMLLGHKDLRMTYRYSLIQNETVYRSFFNAVEQSEFKVSFKLPELDVEKQNFEPDASLQNVVRWIQRNKNVGERKMSLLVMRLNRLRLELRELS